MIPAAVAAALPITLGEIAATAAEALTYRAAFESALAGGAARTVAFRYITSFLRANPGATRAAAAESYQTAKYWATQGSILSKFPADVPIDPSLARDLSGTGLYAAEMNVFRSQVGVTLTDPSTGNTRSYSFYIESFGSLNLEDLFSMASGQVEDVIARSPPPGGSSDVEDYEVAFSLIDFGRYVA